MVPSVHILRQVRCLNVRLSLILILRMVGSLRVLRVVIVGVIRNWHVDLFTIDTLVVLEVFERIDGNISIR